MHIVKIDKSFDINALDNIEYVAGVQIAIEKEIMTKDRYRYIREKLFSHFYDHECYPLRIIEISRDDKYLSGKRKSSYYEELADKYPNMFRSGYIFEFSDTISSEISFITLFKSDNEDLLPLKGNNPVSLLNKIVVDGLEKVYAKSSVDDEFVSIEDIARVNAGFVLSSKNDEDIDDTSAEYRYISTVHMQYPVITPNMSFPKFQYRKFEELHEGTIVLLGQTRNPSLLCKPAIILDSMDQICLSAKLFTVNLKVQDLEYSMYLFEFFSNSQNVISQFSSPVTTISINQFRNLYVPSKEYFQARYSIDPKKFEELKLLSEKLATAKDVVESLTQQINDRLLVK